MALEYPDVMNDVVDARSRYESGAVQYLGWFSPDRVAAGHLAQLHLVLQSVLNIPVDVGVHIEMPPAKRRLRRLPQPLFQVFRPDIRMTLESGEAAELVVPVCVRPHVPVGDYAFRVAVRTATLGPGQRVRPERAETQVGDLRIRHPQGLGIGQLASWGYESRKSREQQLILGVEEAQEAETDPELRPQFTSLWTTADWEWVPAARREANDRRAFTVAALTAEALFVPFMRKTQSVFAGIGIALHLGEAMFIARMLTHAVIYMMGKAEWQDCLLVPIYGYAQANGQATDDAVWLVTSLGYTHIVELGIALAFSEIENALDREVWDPSTQRAVREFVVECLEAGTTLPIEFVYLPLILGGMAVASEMRMNSENVQESLRLLAQARAERKQVFADPELRELRNTYDRLLALHARR